MAGAVVVHRLERIGDRETQELSGVLIDSVRWRRCEEIPGYALWPGGTPCATTMFFELLHN